MTPARHDVTVPEVLAQIQSLARPLTSRGDLDTVVDQVGGARFVGIGEASHGTHEYYHWRGDLSRRLIEEHGFTWIGVEGTGRTAGGSTAGCVAAPNSTSTPAACWNIRDEHMMASWLSHRAIGVVYQPQRERGNYVPTRMGSRYDALLWFEETGALRPLHHEARPAEQEYETEPSGF